MAKVIQIVSGGSVVNAIVVTTGAILAPDRLSVSWGAGEEVTEVAAPEGAVFMDVEGAAIGWVLAGDTLVPPPAPEEPPIDLDAYARAARWRREIAGVTVTIAGESVLVSTSRGDDRSALHMNYSALKDGLRADGAVFNFADGRPRKVSNADMEAAVLAALAHVQDAFDLGETVYAAIIAGAITTTAEIDAAFA